MERGGVSKILKKLQAVLEGYLDNFPETLKMVLKSQKQNVATGAVVDLIAEDLSGWATGPGPTGGATILVTRTGASWRRCCGSRS
jgi:hypothetical protein